MSLRSHHANTLSSYVEYFPWSFVYGLKAGTVLKVGEVPKLLMFALLTILLPQTNTWLKKILLILKPTSRKKLKISFKNKFIDMLI